MRGLQSMIMIHSESTRHTVFPSISCLACDAIRLNKCKTVHKTRL